MDVLIRNHSHCAAGRAREIATLTRRVVREVLRQAEAPEESEVSVLYVDDEEMRGLNEEFRGIDRATDVLAFAMNEGETFPAIEERRLLGDVVVSLESALRQSRQQRHSPRREIAVLLVHGVLHLLGYDHETAQRENKSRMRHVESACLERLEKRFVL